MKEPCRLIDFTNLPTSNKLYAGTDGPKRAVMYQGKKYLLKFPAASSKNKNSCHANSSIAEYIGCHIFNSIGIRAQETTLGVYRKNGAEKIVVACKDFTSLGVVLQDFASLKNSVIDSKHSCYSTELSEIIQAMEAQSAFPPAFLKRHFWDLFIVDALIGNENRSNEDWGFLYNAATDEITIAPVYDCGSSLYPQADEAIMRNTLENQRQRDIQTFSSPLSRIKINSQRINYFDFISSLKSTDCNEALKRILPRINMGEIFRIVDETPFISDLQTQFYKAMLQTRKERILDFSLEKLRRRETAKELDAR